MELKIGESKSFKLPFILKAIDILCEGNGLRLETSGGNIYLYANNGSRRNKYCTIPLGYKRDLKGVEYTVKAQSKTRLLFSVGAVKFVIDFAAKKAATNLIGLGIYGSKEWGDNVQIPWRAEYLPLFGLPLPPMEMDRNTAGLFWQWFHANEADIVRLLNGTKKESKAVLHQIDLWLCPVFPYVKSSKIDFDLECKDSGHTFSFYHGGDEQLKEDAAAFGAMMPEGMERQWKFVVEE